MKQLLCPKKGWERCALFPAGVEFLIRETDDVRKLLATTLAEVKTVGRDMCRKNLMISAAA